MVEIVLQFRMILDRKTLLTISELLFLQVIEGRTALL